MIQFVLTSVIRVETIAGSSLSVSSQDSYARWDFFEDFGDLIFLGSWCGGATTFQCADAAWTEHLAGELVGGAGAAGAVHGSAGGGGI